MAVNHLLIVTLITLYGLFPGPAKALGTFLNPQDTVRFTLEDQVFQHRGASIRQYMPLNEVIDYLQHRPVAKVLIIAHVDSSYGQGNTLLQLSADRAIAVKKYLQSRKVPAVPMETQGKGASEPILPGNTPQRQAFNSRVDIFIIEQKKNQ